MEYVKETPASPPSSGFGLTTRLISVYIYVACEGYCPSNHTRLVKLPRLIDVYIHATCEGHCLTTKLVSVHIYVACGSLCPSTTKSVWSNYNLFNVYLHVTLQHVRADVSPQSNQSGLTPKLINIQIYVTCESHYQFVLTAEAD